MRLVLILVLAATSQRPAGPPHFDIQTIPDPPARDEPWKPPETRLPKFLLNITATLGDQGFADPRGCEYREITLETHRAWQGDPPIVHGWVLPSKAEGSPRFGVGWDGLVHPVSRVGPAVDLDLDIQALLKVQLAAREKASRNPDWGITGFSSQASWDRSIASHESFEASKVILLLRLGRADLAEKLWAAGTDWTPNERKGHFKNYGVSYQTLAADWAWCLFDRALTAHGQGNDSLALARLRELARIRPLIEARADELGFDRTHQQQKVYQDGIPTWSHFDFLDSLPALLADQERRAREPKPENPVDPEKMADRDARITALIRALDRIVPSGHIINGIGNITNSPVVQALIKEGDAAVGPLLDCLESDDRFTRIVSRDTRHNTRQTHVGVVTEAAFGALVSILGTQEFGPVSSQFYANEYNRPKRKSVAAEIRAYWQKNRGLSSEDRWYRTLLDDKASPAQWLDAAEALCQPGDIRGRNGRT